MQEKKCKRNCFFLNTMLYLSSMADADVTQVLRPCANSRPSRFANSALRQCFGTAEFM